MSEHVVRAVKSALIAQLKVLLEEIKQLAEPLSEDRFWTKPIDPGNSFGHLVLHLTGNICHFVGARMGNTGYVRDREREFTETSVPTKAVALSRLENAVAIYCRVAESLTTETIGAQHPDSDKMGTNVHALTKTLTHFALHRGQMSYIARLVSK